MDLWSICFLACPAHYILTKFCKEFMENYWKKEFVEIAYLFSDYIISIGYDEIPQCHNDIENIPQNNLDCFVFSVIGNKVYDAEKLNRLVNENYLFKLSYKRKWEYDIDGKPTFFKMLMERNK